MVQRAAECSSRYKQTRIEPYIEFLAFYAVHDVHTCAGSSLPGRLRSYLQVTPKHVGAAEKEQLSFAQKAKPILRLHCSDQAAAVCGPFAESFGTESAEGNLSMHTHIRDGSAILTESS